MSYLAHRWDAHRKGAQPTADALVVDRKTRRGPGHETADDVGGLVEPEVMQAHGGQARRIPLMADEDELVLVPGKRGALMAGCWIDAPFQNAKGDVHRIRDEPVPRAKRSVARVDQDLSLLHRIRSLGRRQAAQPSLSRGEHIIDPSAHHAMLPHEADGTSSLLLSSYVALIGISFVRAKVVHDGVNGRTDRKPHEEH